MFDYQNNWVILNHNINHCIYTIFIFFGVMAPVNCPLQRLKELGFFVSTGLPLILCFISVSLILKPAYLISFLALQPSLFFSSLFLVIALPGVFENVFMHGVSAGVMAHSPITLTLSGNCTSLEKA